MELDKNRFKCEECGYICDEGEILVAPNPFNDRRNLMGCPKCKEVDCFIGVCSYAGCNRNIVGGIKTDEYGYLTACSTHYQELLEQAV